jgi:hypothetical protein
LKNSTFNVEMLNNCVISAVFMKIKVFCDVTLCRRDIVLYVSKGRSTFNFRVKQPKKNLRRLDGFFIFGSYKYS